MTSPAVTDAERLAAVRRTGLLDTSPEEPFDRLASLARELLGTPFAFVTIVDERRSFWKSCIGVDLGDGPAENSVDESFCQYVVADDEPLVLDDVRLDERTRSNPSIQSMGVVAWAGYPVHSPDGQVLGTFCVVDVVPRRWTERDRHVLHTLSLAAASEVALRLSLDETRRAAARAAELSLVLQQGMLSEPSAAPDLDVAVRYRPATQSAYVGGDWYDAFTRPDGSSVLVVGDVCGHDTSAAATMGELRNLLRGIAFSDDAGPASWLSRTDATLAGLNLSTLATVIVVHLAAPDDDGSRRITCANAGHPPALVMAADGSSTLLAGTPELLLGLVPATARTELTHDLARDETLVLFTDGLVERRGTSLQDGTDGARAVLATTAGRPLDQVSDALLASCDDVEVRDDIAILVARSRS